MTRKLSRSYALSAVVAVSVILTLLIAAATLAQTSGVGQATGQANAVLAQAGTSEPAQAQPRLTSRTGSGGSPVGHSHTRREGARPMDTNPPLFLPVVDYSSGGYMATSVEIADVNGDGHPDLVVGNGCFSSCGGGGVGVLLGNGDGTFQPAVTYFSGGWYADGIAVADVNGDGKPDLVVANCTAKGGDCADQSSGDGVLSVLLGNGDGTFKKAVTYGSGGIGALAVAIADVNGDGKPDLLVVHEISNTVGVLLGKGDGTFAKAQTYPTIGYSVSLAVADVNGDGKPDVITAGSWGAAVLLGNGDGTFQPEVTYGTGGQGGTYSVTVADVNGDGKLDLLVANVCGDDSTCTYGSVGVLLGNGDGTFQAAKSINAGDPGTWSVAVADVNGDGKPDLLVSSRTYNTVGVLLGNGDGTFQPALAYASGGFNAISLAVGDVSGDGAPDLVVANMCVSSSNCSPGLVGVLLNNSGPQNVPSAITLVSSPNPSVFGQVVTFTVEVSSASGTPTGKVLLFEGPTKLGSATVSHGNTLIAVSSFAAGLNSIIAQYQGSLEYAPSASSPLNQVVSIATTTTALASSRNPAPAGQTVTYTAAVTSQYGGATTGTVTFQDAGAAVATVPLTGNQAAYSPVATRGTHAITAMYSGDANNIGSTSPTLVERVTGLVSKTVLATSGSPSLVNQPVIFTATVTSTQGTIPNGELVTFYDGTTAIGTGVTASGVATFTTPSLTVKTHTIKATYAGDDTFESGTGSVEQVVDKYPATTVLSSSLNPSNYGQAVTLTATVTSTGPYQPTGEVTFKNGSATLAGGVLLKADGVATLITAKIPVGANTLTATYNGDAFNGKSVSAAITQTVSQASVSMVLTSTPNPSTFGKSVKFTATLTSNGSLPAGQPVTFSYNGATLGTANVNSKGVATFSTITLPRGSDVVTAAYAGSVDYSSASANLTQIVN